MHDFTADSTLDVKVSRANLENTGVLFFCEKAALEIVAELPFSHERDAMKHSLLASQQSTGTELSRLAPLPLAASMKS